MARETKTMMSPRSDTSANQGDYVKRPAAQHHAMSNDDAVRPFMTWYPRSNAFSGTRIAAPAACRPLTSSFGRRCASDAGNKMGGVLGRRPSPLLAGTSGRQSPNRIRTCNQS
jgi:hypothetical protein